MTIPQSQCAVQLVGPDALQDHERLVLESASMIKTVFLQQNAFSDDDATCSIDKTIGILELLMIFHEECETALTREIPLSRIMELPIKEEVARLRDEPNEGFTEKKDAMLEQVRQVLGELQAR